MTKTFKRSTQHAEIHSNHRIVDPMLQTPAEKMCRQKNFGKLANVFEVASDRACTNRLDSCSPESIQRHTQKFRDHWVKMHIQQQHAHLRKDRLSFNQQAARIGQCISLDRFVVHLRLARWNQEREEKTLHGRVAPVQDSSGLTFRPEVLLKS